MKHNTTERGKQGRKEGYNLGVTGKAEQIYKY